MKNVKAVLVLTALALSIFFLSCVKNPESVQTKNWCCTIAEGSSPDYTNTIGCEADFTILASVPLDASIPGSNSAKTVIDLDNKKMLYFQNSQKYKIHWDFASAVLSGVPSLPEFNKTEYYKPDRRFILGAVTYFEGPKVWTYEIAPYDKASAQMISQAFEQICDSSFFGKDLYFHPTSQVIEKTAQSLPASVKVITTDELYKGIDYQPLNFGTSMGRLTFVTAKSLDTGYVGFRDIVVLDEVPNDISVTSGLITQMFQTPLSHINVLSQNRGTPNMALRGAFNNNQLRSFENKWVRLEVNSFSYSITEVTKAEADEWWKAHQPATVGIPNVDTTVRDLRNVKDILDIKNQGLGGALDAAIPAFGGKASHYGAFPHMDSAKVPYPKGFGIPVYYYWQFMKQNSFDVKVAQMLADTSFQSNPAIRSNTLAALRDSMMKAPVDTAFSNMLFAKLRTEYPNIPMRFRSSTNAEDLDGFTGAGLYVSKTGNLNDPQHPVLDAVREVWSSVWYFRAFEERSYRNIKHEAVGMALLVIRSFPNEEATGVAITNNPYDKAGLEPAFYINVQYGGTSVVLPDPNITTDQIIYYYFYSGQPIVYMGHSSLIRSDTTVLTPTQIHDLGIALEEIHQFFQPLYGNTTGKWWAMDTEFKFDQTLDDPNGKPVLSMKQCRPYQGMGNN